MKTNAARILDGLGLRYELNSYEVGDEHDPAAVVAAKDASRRMSPLWNR
jgi:Cys-tRNA(Pro)/Cys-tRNA(Cys) deacylase